MRIRLHLGATPELADLPWEYLYESRRKRFLARSEYFPVVRYFDLPEPEQPLAVTPPLRVLVMLSNPSDVENLEVEEEYKNLKEAVKPLEEENLLAVERLSKATLSELQQRLRGDPWHIFHFIGHGQFDPVTKQSFLALEHENGRMRLVSGVDIGSFLSDEHSLRLVILNACEGGRASVNDATSGVAQSLVLQGIPAVIAMQFEVSDEAAIALAGGFYKALADNYPVDAALSEARKAIYAADCGVEWGTPVLYLHAPDGRIFDINRTEAQKVEPAVPLQPSPAAMPRSRPQVVTTEIEKRDITRPDSGVALPHPPVATTRMDKRDVSARPAVPPPRPPSVTQTERLSQPEPEKINAPFRVRNGWIAGLIVVPLIGVGIWIISQQQSGKVTTYPVTSPSSATETSTSQRSQSDLSSGYASQSARALIGQWRTNKYAFGDARDWEYLVLDADGTAENWDARAAGHVARGDGPRNTGHWRVEGEMLKLSLGQQDVSGPFAIVNGQLLFRSPTHMEPTGSDTWDKIR